VIAPYFQAGGRLMGKMAFFSVALILTILIGVLAIISPV
jgi:hypothetical protein